MGQNSRTTEAPAKATALPMDRLRGEKKRYVVRTEIAMDADLARDLYEAQEAAERAETLARSQSRNAAARDEAERARRAADRLADEAAPTVARFLFRSIPKDEWDKLLIDYPPTDKQKDEYGSGIKYDPVKLPPTLIERTLVWTGTGDDEWPTGESIPREPCYSADDVAALWNDPEWSGTELSALFDGALEAVTTRRVVDLGKGSRKRAG